MSLLKKLNTLYRLSIELKKAEITIIESRELVNKIIKVTKTKEFKELIDYINKLKNTKIIIIGDEL